MTSPITITPPGADRAHPRGYACDVCGVRRQRAQVVRGPRLVLVICHECLTAIVSTTIRRALLGDDR